ncbi:MAG: hypothetical protein JXR20_12550 [Balneola sp.]
MKNLKLRITSRQLCHTDPDYSGERSTNLINCAGSSLSLRMTAVHFEFLIREAL